MNVIIFPHKLRSQTSNWASEKKCRTFIPHEKKSFLNYKKTPMLFK